MPSYCESKLGYDQSSSMLQLSEIVRNNIKANGVKHLSTAHWHNLSTLNLGNQALIEAAIKLGIWEVSG